MAPDNLRSRSFGVRSGSARGPFGVRAGSVRDPFSLVRGLFGIRAGSVQGPFGIRAGSVRSPFRIRSGSVRGSVGIRSGLVRSPFGIRSWSVRGPLGVVWSLFGIRSGPETKNANVLLKAIFREKPSDLERCGDFQKLVLLIGMTEASDFRFLLEVRKVRTEKKVSVS